MTSKVVHHEYDPLSRRHLFVMDDGVFLQADHDFMIACETKEVFQQKMEELHAKVRAAGGGNAKPFSDYVPEVEPARAVSNGGTESQSGRTGQVDRAEPTNPDEIYVAGPDELGTGGDVGC